jgi:hypothetical protein
MRDCAKAGQAWPILPETRRHWRRNSTDFGHAHGLERSPSAFPPNIHRPSRGDSTFGSRDRAPKWLSLSHGARCLRAFPVAVPCLSCPNQSARNGCPDRPPLSPPRAAGLFPAARAVAPRDPLHPAESLSRQDAFSTANILLFASTRRYSELDARRPPSRKREPVCLPQFASPAFD